MSSLLQPYNNGKLSFKNRLVMPPMATSKALPDGKVSPEILDYYDEKSRGGHISLIIIEHSFISMQGKASEKQMSVAEDSVVDGLKQLADVIHKNGSKAAMQINHAGSAANSAVTGQQTVSASDVTIRRGETPRELTIEEIHGIVRSFADAAGRVKAAGFDGVEIHAAHGYLLSQFYSPLTNKRTDEYGSDLNGRIKLHLDVIKAVRAAVGQDFTVIMRLGASDYMAGGAALEDTLAAAPQFEKAGLDMLDISGGFCGYTVPELTGQGFFHKITEELKKEISIPVILTGGITDPKAADALIAEGKTDFAGVGRAIYKDSNWAANAVAEIHQMRSAN